MNDYNSRRSGNGKTYYDVLEVAVNADAVTIRKSYLKKSLKYHPDKNPDNEEEAKANFIEVGEAYETLSDPSKRRMYDQELRATGGRKTNSFKKNPHADASDDQAYDNYMDAFDATVAGMSPTELEAMIGTVSALAGIVGSMVGSHVLRRGTGDRRHGSESISLRNSVLGAAGSMVGGYVASEIASSSVRALHQNSIDRLRHKEDCRRAVERGESIPERPQELSIRNRIGSILKNTMGSFNNMDTGTTGYDNMKRTV